MARWNDTVPLNYNGMFANAFFDFHTQAHQYWIFRPGSDIDTVNGDIYSAHLCQAEGRTSFGPDTDPHPYLTDGTPDTSFVITDIRENGTELTFHVHFLTPREGIDEVGGQQSAVRMYAENGRIVVIGAEGEEVQVFDMMGRRVQNSALPAGVYVVRVGDNIVRRIVVVR